MKYVMMKKLRLALFPVDIKRNLNVHKMFRICPGRLLNVLCTFNLRPVSTGLYYQVKEDFKIIKIISTENKVLTMK